MKEKLLIMNCVKKQIEKIENKNFKLIEKQLQNEIILKQLNQVELYVRTHLTGHNKGQKVTLVCEECGKEYTLSKYRNYDGRRFCSHNCYTNNKSKVALGKHLQKSTPKEITDFLSTYNKIIFYFIHQYSNKYNLRHYDDEQYSDFCFRLPYLMNYIKEHKIKNKSDINKLIKLVIKENAIKLFNSMRNEVYIADIEKVKNSI